MNRSDSQAEQKMEHNQYEDKDLIEVKIALHLPYMTSWTEYQRVDGKTEVDGIFYNYVKRKISNDTLYLLCLPNAAKTNLGKARNEYAGHVNDTPASKDGKASGKKINIANEYHPQINDYELSEKIGLPVFPKAYFYSPITEISVGGKYKPPRRTWS